MARYAHYKKSTKELLGFYDDSVHSIIPTPNIEVSPERALEISQQPTTEFSKWVLTKNGKDFEYVEDDDKARKELKRSVEVIMDRELEKPVPISVKGTKMLLNRNTIQDLNNILLWMEINNKDTYGDLIDAKFEKIELSYDEIKTIRDEVLNKMMKKRNLGILLLKDIDEEPDLKKARKNIHDRLN